MTDDLDDDMNDEMDGFYIPPQDPREILAAQHRSLMSRGKDREDRFEADCVMFALKSLRVAPEVKKRFLAICSERSTDGRPSWEIFREIFPVFPVFLWSTRLEGKKIASHPKGKFTAWFRKFEETPFFREFKANTESSAGALNHGMIFPFENVAHGLIIHDLDVEASGWPRLVYSPRSDIKTEKILVEPFERFLSLFHFDY